MDLPFCKICGERHRLGHCPEWDGPTEKIHAAKTAPAPKADQHHKAQGQAETRQQAGEQARQLPPQTIGSTAPVPTPSLAERVQPVPVATPEGESATVSPDGEPRDLSGGVEGADLSPRSDKPKFDRNAYQRELMRTRRAEGKA